MIIRHQGNSPPRSSDDESDKDNAMSFRNDLSLHMVMPDSSASESSDISEDSENSDGSRNGNRRRHRKREISHRSSNRRNENDEEDDEEANESEAQQSEGSRVQSAHGVDNQREIPEDNNPEDEEVYEEDEGEIARREEEERRKREAMKKKKEMLKKKEEEIRRKEAELRRMEEEWNRKALEEEANAKKESGKKKPQKKQTPRKRKKANSESEYETEISDQSGSEKRTTRSRSRSKQDENEEDEEIRAAQIFSTRMGLDRVFSLRDEEWRQERDPENRTYEHEFQPIFHPIRAMLEMLLLEGESPHSPSCFACTHGDVAGVTIEAFHWNIMMNMYLGMVLRISINELFVGMYRYFCDNVVVRNKLGGKVDTSKIWSPFGIARHFFEHNQDPLFTTIRDIIYIDHLIQIELYYNSTQFHMSSSRPRANPRFTKPLMDLYKIKDHLLKRKTDHCIGYNPNCKLSKEGYAHLHPSARTQYNNSFTDSLNLQP